MIRMPRHKFVFICGLHRSGTSVFFRTLREHPEISGFKNTGVPADEGQHLQSVYPAAWVFGGPGKFGFNTQAHLIESSPLVTQENKAKLMREWAQYWNMNKSVLIEKSPPNIIRSRFLQTMFENTYFISLTRHPIAVSYATGKQRFHNLILRTQFDHWLHCHDIFNRDKIHLNRLLFLKYEDFVINTNKCLKQVYSFLDIEYLPSTVKINSNTNNKYFLKWQKFQDTPVLRLYAKYLINNYEERVNQHGYSLKDLNYYH